MAQGEGGSDTLGMRDGAALKEKGAAQAAQSVKNRSILVQGIIAHVGENWFNSAVKLHKAKCAKEGIFGWEPDDTNILCELSPAPAPHLGDWCYRTRMVGTTNRGVLVVTETFLPSSQLKKYGASSSFTN